ncbi:queuosine precursor transporter [Chlamydia avium]|uniref:Queuosine precursor transporter n=1 Tax=Chlamydia avium 10DC88 TaxID=1229831 RepID=W8JLT5_9CHLA|nr:queuosine precursor transporter [Chlamydia avium]AHK63234.1 Putative integral membrane family protein [Chlamydia avium 10DC88]
MLSNEVIFFAQASLIIILGITFASRSIAWLTAWLSTLSIIMNVFVLKQIILYGLEVTSADVYLIGMLSSLNYSRELYGRNKVNEAMFGSWIITVAFLIITQLHLALIPSSNDVSQPHFIALFSPTLRLIIASLITLICVQTIDLVIFTYLKKLFHNKAFGTRSALSLILSQILDTLLFSFLGLYGLVANLAHVMLFAFITKMFIIILSIPMVSLGKFLKTKIKLNHIP